jgi:hypothetical protein
MLKKILRDLIKLHYKIVDDYIEKFIKLRDRGSSSEYQKGVQDCIDILISEKIKKRK